MLPIKVNELVLQVTKNIDPEKLDLDKYEDFLEELCGHREFQKEAIRTAVRFLLSGEYKNTEDLAKENFDTNPALKEYYKSFENFKNKLEFPDKLACTIDLATATGKSWVMYGIAQILLCEGAVDQVLILCPSRTVKRELLKKFEKFVIDKNLRAALQDEAIPIKANPSITDASRTIKKWDICIDNVHKTYAHVTSSISDSLKGKGERTLVLNDESHHIMNPEVESIKTDVQAMKEWKKFLLDKNYNFKFIVGFTGTPYMRNEYARDVVYRYSIMQAMEGDMAGNFVIKKVEYLKESNAKTWPQKLEEIYANHQRNKKTWDKADKHITIFVTQTINKAEKLANDIKNFLIDKEKITPDKAEKKVLVVTSSPKHEANREILKEVNNTKNPVEWIVSVSMLTEGWDVDNVFQIVPHEERAFNSKLLIAQVLGRGLRVPKNYSSEQPTVIVYNHYKWGEAIRELVEEVMDYEKRVRSYIVDKEKDYNFELHNMKYEKIEVQKKLHLQKGKYEIPKIPELSTQSGIIKLRTTYFQIKEQKEKEVVTQIPVKLYSVERTVNDVVNKLDEFYEERGMKCPYKIDKQKLKVEIEHALKKADPEKTGMLTEENKNRIERAFDVLKREATGTTVIKRVSQTPYIIRTKDIPAASAKVSEFLKNKAVVYEESSIKLSKKEDRELIEEASNEAPRKNVIIIDNKYLFKCPLNVVILSHNNEREFARYLAMPEYAQKIDAWIKSVDRGFYDVPYTYRKGTHQKWAKFNPDFFIKIGKDILIAEIKSDEDITQENKAKLKYAKIHFEELNKKQKKFKYYFKFLSPQDFPQFFEAIKAGNYAKYTSNLEAELKV
ncbi:MAG: DEAD/DEAH box helicase family protein [Candidatus Pacearchaeota archaeon]|nr:DEAD/DEAH box helicase family protein [Candidatus Pacearchaeota archaeon]